MATPKNVKIFQIQTDDLENLLNGQIGVSTIDDVDLGIKLWGGKDSDGKLSKWLQMDEHARVEVISFTQEDSIFVGSMTPHTLSATNSVLIGNGITCGTKKEYGITKSDGNIMVGQNVYNNSESHISTGILIGNSACANLKFSGSHVDTRGAVFNMISIGDGAGINTMMTSGAGNIFIVKDAGRIPDGEHYYRANTIIIGNTAGHMTDCDSYVNYKWKYFDLGAGNNNVGYGTGYVESNPSNIELYQNNKFIVHSDSCPFSLNSGEGRTLPSMVLATSVANYNPNPSKFFGPMTNVYGNFNGATCFILLSANPEVPGGINALMTTIDTTISVSVSRGFDNVMSCVDFMMYKNVLISACDGVFSDPTRWCAIACAVASNSEGTITFVGDTAHREGQLAFSYSISSYECIAHIAGTGSTGSGRGSETMHSIMLGDSLCGYDGQARVIKVTTINNKGRWHTISDVSKKVQWIPPSPDWVYNSANIPFRFTRGVSFSTTLHRSRAGSSVSYAVVGRMIGVNTFTVVTGFSAIAGKITVTSPTYDEYNISVIVDGSTDDNHWFIADDLHTFKPIGT